MIDMTELKPIDYRVKDANNFFSFNGKDDIKKINQKNSEFTFLGKNLKFEIQLNLSSPAIISIIEFKVKQVNQIHFQFYLKGLKVAIKAKQISGDHSKFYTDILHLEKDSVNCDTVVVSFINVPNARETTINYILFKGFKEEVGERKKTQAARNVSKNDQQFKNSVVKVPIGQKHTVFSERKKKASPAELEQEALYFGRESDKKSKENGGVKKTEREKSRQKNAKDDLQMAIQLSKKQQQRQNEMKEEFLDQFIDYKTEDYTESLKRVYEHVTAEWLENQMKLQRNHNILPRHSLNSVITIKALKNCKFCINGIFKEEKAKLIKIIKQLGGNYLENPQNNCIIISEKSDGNVIKMAKGMKEINILLPQYLFDCQSIKSKISYEGYRV